MFPAVASQRFTCHARQHVLGPTMAAKLPLLVVLVVITLARTNSLNVLSLAGTSETIACDSGAVVTVQPLQPSSECGISASTWRVTLETGAGLPVYLGEMATQDSPLKLKLKRAVSSFYVKDNKVHRRQATLRRSGTYLVQQTVEYASCPPAYAETRFTIGQCPAAVDKAGFELQECHQVKEPGKRKVSLVLSAFDPDGNYPIKQLWRLVPKGAGSIAAAASFSSSIAEFSFDFGPAAVPAPAPFDSNARAVTCKATSGLGNATGAPTSATCVVYVGSGAGRLQPGRSYSPMYKFTNALGLGEESWTPLQHLDVPKCPPRITKAAVNLKGSCKSWGGRWVELKAAAVDLEEGPAGPPVTLYWTLLSARTRNVAVKVEGAGQFVKVKIGQMPKQLQPGRYFVQVTAVAKSGEQLSSTRQQVGRVFEVPPCK